MSIGRVISSLVCAAGPLLISRYSSSVPFIIDVFSKTPSSMPVSFKFYKAAEEEVVAFGASTFLGDTFFSYLMRFLRISLAALISAWSI